MYIFIFLSRYGSETNDVSVQTQIEKTHQMTQTDLSIPQIEAERRSFISSMPNESETEIVEENIEEIASKMLSIQSQTEPVNKGKFYINFHFMPY